MYTQLIPTFGIHHKAATAAAVQTLSGDGTVERRGSVPGEPAWVPSLSIDQKVSGQG